MERITLTSKPQLFSCMKSRQYSQKFQLSKPNLLHSNVYALRKIISAKKSKDNKQQPKIQCLFLILSIEESQLKGSYGSSPVSLMKPIIANASV